MSHFHHDVETLASLEYLFKLYNVLLFQFLQDFCLHDQFLVLILLDVVFLDYFDCLLSNVGFQVFSQHHSSESTLT